MEEEKQDEEVLDLDDDSIELLEVEEAEDLIRKMVDDHNVARSVTFWVGEGDRAVEFTAIAVDFQETEAASREVDGLDILTKELVYQRTILSRAIKRINKKRSEPKVVAQFIKKAPPTLIRIMYENYLSLVSTQAKKFRNIHSLVKK